VFEIGSEPIPGYRLLGSLGQGGCGVVWEAARPDSRSVALKFLDCRNQPPGLVANEIRTLRRIRSLEHPNMIRLHDICAVGQYVVLIMDRADGNLLELEEVYRQETGRHIPCDHLLEMMEQAAAGLDFLSRQPTPGMSSCNGNGMQHCDVKPSNLLTLDDTLKIADFGLCMSSLSTTHRQRFMGTAPYAAPELYEGRVTSHTDQYGLAVTYCELISGGRAFLPPGSYRNGESPVDLRKLRVCEAPIVARALDQNWTNRWPSCVAFVTALQQALARTRPAPVKKMGSLELAALHRMTR
jgi:serine/threonine protein kinase